MVQNIIPFRDLRSTKKDAFGSAFSIVVRAPLLYHTLCSYADQKYAQTGQQRITFYSHWFRLTAMDDIAYESRDTGSLGTVTHPVTVPALHAVSNSSRIVVTFSFYDDHLSLRGLTGSQ